MLLKRAAVLYERANLEDKAIETYQNLVKLEPGDEELRNALEARYVKANRYRDVARMLEQALATDPPPDAESAGRIRAKLIDVFANQLKEPERAMPHVEALLEADPTHPEARRVATRLLESKGLAARAAAALADGRADDRGARALPRRSSSRTRAARAAATSFVASASSSRTSSATRRARSKPSSRRSSIDPADDELRQRYVELGIAAQGPARGRAHVRARVDRREGRRDPLAHHRGDGRAAPSRR